jgi:methionyl-tRNA formyltransferase
MRLVVMGTGLFAEPTLEALLPSRHRVVGLVTQPDRTAGTESGSTRQTGKGMKNIALEHGIPVFQPVDINAPEGLAGLAAFQPDLLVVAAYGQILKPAVLAVAPHGGINVHASLLPKYRGAAPIARAIHEGETQTGVTIIQMSPKLDAGGMLAQEAVDIGPEETAGELEARLAPLGARMALEIVDRIDAGTAQRLEQEPGQVTRAPKLTKENGLIDWSKPAAVVCNQVRAMHPWPTAYTFWRSVNHPPLRLIVHRVRTVELPTDAGVLAPGDLLPQAGSPPRLVVATGAGGVEVLELQPAGKRRMKAEEFLRGRPVRPGDRMEAS